ncbi:MAG: NAD(P)/FAD-dependent oxidoreductase [Chloroflexota bacterium]|nr:NAD(P)/FAD-dependent oxidoreductase [Chloroflexota bacterium]
MEQFDFVVVGAGAAGEAAAHMARRRGASVAIVDRDLFGGSCAFWACIPSKTLLHAAAVRATGGDYPWPRASDRRDYMINREGRGYPDDTSHADALAAAGATVLRGEARVAGPGRVEVGENGSTRLLAARDIVIAVGSHSKVPNIDGLDRIGYWTNVQATSLRELPESIAILGGGPTGVELAQVYARYGVATTLVHPKPLILDREHPRSSRAIAAGLERDGVAIRTGVHAQRVGDAGRDGAKRVELSDGSSVEAREVLLSVGRSSPLAGLGLETVGVDLDGRDALHPDDRLRIAPHVFAVGDPAGPELHTHLAHYQGEMAVRIALGDDVRPDYRAIPRATYTDPEVASVGIGLEQARDEGRDAFEETADLATSAKGYVTESGGHVSIVVERSERILLGAFIAGPGASEAIHEAVLAIKTRTPLDVLADTLHAFPTTARVMGGLFAEAAGKAA